MRLIGFLNDLSQLCNRFHTYTYNYTYVMNKSLNLCFSAKMDISGARLISCEVGKDSLFVTSVTFIGNNGLDFFTHYFVRMQVRHFIWLVMMRARADILFPAFTYKQSKNTAIHLCWTNIPALQYISISLCLNIWICDNKDFRHSVLELLLAESFAFSLEALLTCVFNTDSCLSIADLCCGS